MNYSVHSVFSVTGRSSLVVGGASGIGREIALALGKNGAKVAIADINLDGADETVALIEKEGGCAVSVFCDVTNRDSVRQAVTHVIQSFDRLDIAYNMPGINIVKPALDYEPEEWEKVLKVNLTGTFFCCQEEGRVMVTQGKGSIINMGSTYGLTAMDGEAVYSASKGGIIMLSKVLAVEWAQKGVRVNILVPGHIRTPLSERVFRDEKWLNKVLRGFPMGRIGESSELVGAALFLGSDASSFATGSVLVVDGGWTAW